MDREEKLGRPDQCGCKRVKMKTDFRWTWAATFQTNLYPHVKRSARSLIRQVSNRLYPHVTRSARLFKTGLKWTLPTCHGSLPGHLTQVSNGLYHMSRSLTGHLRQVSNGLYPHVTQSARIIYDRPQTDSTHISCSQ